jgi:hypothetical protein
MAPKTRSADSPLVSPPDSPDPGSQPSTLDPTPDTLALLLAQMARINARLDSHPNLDLTTMHRVPRCKIGCITVDSARSEVSVTASWAAKRLVAVQHVHDLASAI